MARRRLPVRNPLDVGAADEASLLDVIDSVLNKGAVLNGDLILGVANVDLVYAKLSILLAALDKVTRPARKVRTRQRKTKARKKERRTKERKTKKRTRY